MSNLWSFIFEIMLQVLLLLIKVWVKDHNNLEFWEFRNN